MGVFCLHSVLLRICLQVKFWLTVGSASEHPNDCEQQNSTEQKKAWTVSKNSNCKYRRVSNAALANPALVLSSKSWKKYSSRGCGAKKNQKSLGAWDKAQFVFVGAPPIENKIKQKIQTLRWRLAKGGRAEGQPWSVDYSKSEGRMLNACINVVTFTPAN